MNYVTVDPLNFIGQYVNVNRAIAHGAEVVLRGKLSSWLLLDTSYIYTSRRILDNPAPIDVQYDPGQPWLRRLKHSATETLSYLGSRWGRKSRCQFCGPPPRRRLPRIQHPPCRRVCSRRGGRRVRGEFARDGICQHCKRVGLPGRTELWDIRHCR